MGPYFPIHWITGSTNQTISDRAKDNGVDNPGNICSKRRLNPTLRGKRQRRNKRVTQGSHHAIV